MSAAQKLPKVVPPPAASQDVEIPPILLQVATVPIKGISPLIVHRFGEKARKMMEAKQAGAARQKKPPKIPEEEFKAALYFMPGDPKSYAFPAVAFKIAMVEAARHVDGLKMTQLRGAFHVLGEYVKIEGPEPTMRTDTVRLESGVADLRHRPEFRDWRATLQIRYLSSTISLSQLIHLLNVGGFTVGIGENRPGKSGNAYGQFEVDTERLASALDEAA